MKKLILSLLLCSIFIYHVAAQEQDVRTVVQTGHLSTIKDYDISADGRYAVTLDWSNKVILWRLKTGHQYRDFNEKDPKEVYFNSKSNAFIVVCKKYTVAYDIPSGKRICYWGENSQIDNLKVKRVPKDIRCEKQENSLLIHSIKTGNKMAELKSMVDEVYQVAVMRKGNATDEIWWASSNTPVQWNLKTGQITNRISFQGKMSNKMWFDANGNLVFWNGKNNLSIYNAFDGKKMSDIKLAGKGMIHALTFLSDNQNVVYDRNNRIWQTNINTQKSDSLPYAEYYSNSPTLHLNDDGTGDITTEKRHNILGPTWASVKDFKNANNMECKVVGLGRMSTPNEYFALFDRVWVPIKMKLGSKLGTMVGGNFQDYPKVLYQTGSDYDIVRGSFTISLLSNLNLVGKYTCNNATCASMFGPNLLAAGKEDGSIWLYDRESSRLTAQFKPHNSIITSICQSPSQRLVLTTSNDGAMGLFDTQKKELIAYLMSSDDGREYIIRTPDNYYMSSRYGTDAIHFAMGTETYQFDQFDLKYNRPDIVLSRIGLADEKQIRILRRAYEKRLKKMHFTEEMLSNDFHVPSLFIKNAVKLSQAKTPNQEIQIEASDSRYNISSVNVWVNGVPSFGVEGKPVSKQKKLTMKIPITLTRGHNTIQVSCMNERGAESYKETVETDIPIPSIKPDLWIVTIGVSHYKDQRFNLNYASKDAQDIAEAISGANNTSYQIIHTLTIKDNDVTKEALIKIKDFLSSAGRDDTVVLFYAGHGLVDENLDYFLGTYDTDFSSPSSLSIPYEDFASLLDGITPLQKLLLIDACHSGEIDKEDVVLAQAQRTNINKGNIVFRSSGEKLPQSVNSTAEQLDVVLAENFGNLSRGSGATIISSSSGLQVSVESDKWKNGLFSYCIIQGLRDKNCDTNKDGKINIGELQRYCQQQVFQLSGGRQRPSSRYENRQLNFVIGNY